MMMRALSTGLMFAAAVAVGASYAQQAAAQQRTVARLTGMQGSVLVSQGDAMVAAGSDQRVPAGARVVTTAGAGVTVLYDTGCAVRLNQNQRFLVREAGECPALIASVETLAPASGAIGGTGAGMTVGGVSGTGLVIGVLAFGGIVWGISETQRKSDTVSPF